MNGEQVIESVNERDIDLILLEELNVNSDFFVWIIAKIGLPEVSEIDGAWRSVRAYGQGETDILLSYSSNDQKVYVLIENKLDASFQKTQYDRYVGRATKYCEDGVCNIAYSLLVAPTQYCENQTDFDRYLTYESIGEFLQSAGGKRGIYKSSILDIAINKLRRGFQVVNFPPVQEFWMAYWLYKGSNYPTLVMKRPNVVPEGSDWPVLKVEGLAGVRFYHKLNQGNVDAELYGVSKDSMVNLEKRLPEGTRVKYLQNKVSIKVATPQVYREKDFESQVQAVDAGLKQIVVLVEAIGSLNR